MGSNEQYNSKVEVSNENPKPSDEVQLTIETVTPDTHKSVPPTDVNSKEVEEAVGKSNDKNNGEALEDRKLEQQIDSEHTKEESTESDDNDELSKKDPNEDTVDDAADGTADGDERDQIETVSP